MPTPPRARSMAAVAEALKLSTTTISNAYNRPEKLSPALRERILSYAADVGYQGPNPIARQLSRGRTDTIGLVFVDELRYAVHRALAAFIEGLAEACETVGHSLLLIPTGTGSSDRRIDKIATAAVDGLIVYSPADGDERLAVALSRRQPVVVVEGPRSPAVSWVGLDDRTATYTLAGHLLALGHRRFGIVSLRLHPQSRSGFVTGSDWGSARYRVPRERIGGIVDALADADEVGCMWVYECADSSVASGAQAARALMDAHPEITAVMAMDDVLALGVLDAAAARSWQVPGQLSVTGFDDVAEARWHGLTTIRQPIRDKGQVAGRLLLEQINADTRRAAANSAIDVVLPAELAVRTSTGPPRTPGRVR